MTYLCNVDEKQHVPLLQMQLTNARLSPGSNKRLVAVS